MKKEVIDRLRQILGAPGVTEDETDLLVYECDALTLFKNKPDVVVFPQTTEQVAQIVRVANEFRIPFVPRGAGTTQPLQPSRVTVAGAEAERCPVVG